MTDSVLTQPLDVQLPVEIEGRLTELAQLHDGWHDGDGLAVQAGVIEGCRSLIRRLALAGVSPLWWHIGPDDDGTLNMQTAYRKGKPSLYLYVMAKHYELVVMTDDQLPVRVNYSYERRGELAVEIQKILDTK